MSRPQYETAVDRFNEFEVINDFLDAHQKLGEIVPIKMGIKYGVDFQLIDQGNRVRAWAEVKQRDKLIHQYKTYLLSAHKWRDAMALHRINPEVPFLLLVRWLDGSGVWSTKDADFENWPPPGVHYGGRIDRNDKQDQEPCVHIPISQFRIYRRG